MTKLGARPHVPILDSPTISFKVDDDSFEPMPADYFNRRLGIPTADQISIYLGLLAPERGINTIAEAFSGLDIDAPIVIVGCGPLEATIQQLSEKHANIHFSEAVQHDRVVPLGRNVDFGSCLVENVPSSDIYCVPNKLFMYAFAGLPILASKFLEIGRIVDPYFSRIFVILT